MAPTWYGPRLRAICKACGEQSEVVQEAYDPAIPTRCFGCGAVCDCSNEVIPGETIEVTSQSDMSTIRRLDVVVLNTPSLVNEEVRTLKRVWALPGEQIELRAGEAWINGKQLKKSARELASVCVPLSRFPSDIRSHWWVADPLNGQAQRIEVLADPGYVQLAKNAKLEFRYTRPNRNPESPQMIASEIVDDYAFNQNSTALFHSVPDFLVAVELSEPTSKPWFVSVRSGNKQYRVGIGANATQETNAVCIDWAERLLVAICDTRLLVSSEHREAQWELSDLNGGEIPADESTNTLISLATSDTLRIKRLLVARDQWLGPRESRLTEWVPSDSLDTSPRQFDGYFVLGDNLALSVDSRDNRVGRIAPHNVVGQIASMDKDLHWILGLLNHSTRDLGKD